LLLATLMATSCSKPKLQRTTEPPSVAKVGTQLITVGQFQRKLRAQPLGLQQALQTPDGTQQLLQNMIRFALLVNEAQKRGLDKDLDVQQAMQNVMVRKLSENTVAKAIGEISDDDLKAAYEKSLTLYERPKRVQVRQLSLPKTFSGAAALRTKLVQQVGKNVNAFSTDVAELPQSESSKSRGGDLGLRTREALEKATSPEVAAAAFALEKEGQVSAVIEDLAGFHILQLVANVAGSRISFEEAKPSLREQIESQRRADAMEKLLNELTKSTPVVIDHANVATALATPR